MNKENDGLKEKINQAFNNLPPKGLDSKLLILSDKIATSMYNKYEITNNQISKYLHMGGATTSIISGGLILPSQEIFGIAMLLYTGYHIVMAKISSKREEVDKTKLISTRKNERITIDEEKIAQYVTQQTERKHEKFRRIGTIGISLGITTLGTICALSGTDLPLTLGLYAYSGSAILDSFAQYMKVAEINIDPEKLKN